MTSRVEADVCVVGLGGSGLSAVRQARRQGLTVVGLDAAHVAAGAAGRNGGFLLAGAAHFHHETRRRYDASLARTLYRLTEEQIEWMDRVEPSVRRVGSLRIATGTEEERDIDAHLTALRDDGFEVQRYEGLEGAGLCVPGDGVFDPVLWCSRQTAAALREGALLHEHSRATEIGPGRVTTDQGEVSCRWVVVAIDADLAALFPEMSARVTPWRLQMLATAPVPPLTDRAVYRRYGYDYYQQLPDGRLALGGGRDVGGEAERDAPLGTSDTGTSDTGTSDTGTSDTGTSDTGTSDTVQRYLDDLSQDICGSPPEVERRWSGRVGYTDDGLPVAEEIRDGVFAVGGYSGTGNAIGMICGREAVSRFVGGPTPFLDTLQAMKA